KGLRARCRPRRRLARGAARLRRRTPRRGGLGDMPSFLVFRLYGPLASWGEVAVGEVRPSNLHPTRSALLGLLGAALGLRRSDEAALADLARTVRFAVR